MKPFLVTLVIIFICNGISAQINFDYTDSLANQQKQYIIRFNVADGNIYLPVKKKLSLGYSRFKIFRRDLIDINDSIYVPLYKDTIMDGKIVKWKYAMNKIYNPEFKVRKLKDTIPAGNIPYKSHSDVRYLASGRFLKPEIGSFIRLVFENVPENIDVNVNAEFLDKNLENASTFEGYLNKFGSQLDNAVDKETEKARNDTSKKKRDAQIKLESTSKDVADTINIFTDKSLAYIRSLDSLYKLQKNSNTNFSNDSIEGFRQSLLEIKRMSRVLLDASKDQIRTPVDLTEISDGMIDSITNISNYIKTHPIKQKPTKQEGELNFLANKLIYLINDKFKNENIILIKYYDSIIKSVHDSLYLRRTIYIQPIQVANNDISLLKITFKNTADNTLDIYREILLKNKFGFKLDFSTGFIGTGLLDSNYRIVPAPGRTRDTSKIIADQKGNFAIGFAILAHAYVRTGDRINFAVNSGLMLNSSNQTINYLAGISIPWGLEERFVFSGGIAFGKVKRLTSDYQPNVEYPANVLNLSAGVPYTDKWKSSWYLGFSYNLSSLSSSSHKIVIAR